MELLFEIFKISLFLGIPAALEIGAGRPSYYSFTHFLGFTIIKKQKLHRFRFPESDVTFIHPSDNGEKKLPFFVLPKLRDISGLLLRNGPILKGEILRESDELYLNLRLPLIIVYAAFISPQMLVLWFTTLFWDGDYGMTPSASHLFLVLGSIGIVCSTYGLISAKSFSKRVVDLIESEE